MECSGFNIRWNELPQACPTTFDIYSTANTKLNGGSFIRVKEFHPSGEFKE